MPRIPRNIQNTIYFHVMTQGIEKSRIFDDTQDIKHYIQLIYKFAQSQNIKVVAYCIMNNHAHMLIKSESVEDLSKFMQRLNTSYAKYYNTKYSRVGFVFRDRFKAEGIYSERQMYTCINYIYNNPIKAGICSNPSKYPFSNYRQVPFIFDSQYSFIDEVDGVDNTRQYQETIQDFIMQNNMTLELLNKDAINLKKLIVLLKAQGISLRKIAEVLDINREKIRNIYSN